ncbi:copper resistance D family protein [Arsukibacterium sp.]|uniref:copper resistance D family protein n=1 Tax=Arsukibacterium sp. TaxID=1977258 RepID=UPI003561956A
MDITNLITWLARVLTYVATAGVVGGYFIWQLTRFHATVLRWLRCYITVCAALGIAAVLLAFSTQLLMFSGQGLAGFYDWELYTILLSGKPGFSWGLALAGFSSGILAMLFCGKSKLSTLLMLLGASAILLSFTFTGHLVSTPWYGKFALLLHLLAISLWLGSLLPLWHLTRRAKTELLASVMTNFGKLAMVFVGVLLVMGVVMLQMLLGDLRLLWQTAYGQTMLIKLTMVTLLLGLGATNKLWLVPQLAKPEVVKRLRAVIGVEMLVGLLVLASTAWATVVVGLDMS